MTHRWVLTAALLTAAGLSGQVIPGRYIVELAGEPAATFAARQQNTRQAASDRRQAIAIEQQQIRPAVARAGGRVRGSVDTVANALFVEVPEDRLDELAQTPGVLRIHRVRRVRALLNRVLPIHLVPEAWARIGGSNAAGAGMKIAIVDTGIDQSHIGFDAGLPVPEGFPRVSSDRNQAFVRGKVIVARSYEDLGGEGYEPDAGDRIGHGTNAAFAAAGIRLQFANASQISGVAPAAYLGNYKALGSNGGGSNDVIIKAIDDAVKDGMDVINLSLGADLAENPDTDLEVRAVEAAVGAGVIVVAAAGNAGPDENTIDSPGTAPSAITVGSSSSDRSASDGTPIDPNRVSDFSSRGPNLGAGLKPDLLAVGDNFVTADTSLKPDAMQFTITQGTSFATPVIAGAGALLKAARPGFNAAVYRSLLINSAKQLIYASGQPAPVRYAGAGRLNMDAALQSTVAVAPTSLKFGAGAGTVDVTQPLAIANIGATTATFTLTVEPFPGSAAAPALSVPSVTLEAGTVTNIQVRFAGANLAAGEYQGRIVIRSSASTVESGVPYWYAVASATPSAISVLEMPVEGGPGSTKLFGLRIVDRSGLALDTPVGVTPMCGGETTVGRDPSVPGATLVQATLGSTVGSNVFRVDAAGLRRYITVSVTGEVDASSSYVPACGITNGASFIAGDVAPGSFASIFGNRLASGLVQNTQVPLATQLDNTRVTINGVPAPLFFVSPGQINLQIPYGASPGPASATVTVGGKALSPVPFTVSPTAPGVLQFGANRAVAVNQDGSLNNVDNPAAVGSSIVIYGTGQGGVDNPVATGDIAPASGNPLSRPTAGVRVTIGGVDVQPFFAGLTPGFVGLLQVNLTIPPLLPGTYPLVASIGGAPSKAVLLTVR